MSHLTPSEDELIHVIQRSVKNRGRVRLGIGDDAAVLKDGTVVTTDAYAEGVHFDFSYMTLRQVGERCACGAISDVVAMAAEPEAVFVSLALPHDSLCLAPRARSRINVLGVKDAASSLEQQVHQLYSGIDSVCGEMGCEVAGGDIIVTDRLQLALTVTGKTRRPKLRSGVQPGDMLYVTGHLGSAEAGRLLLADKVGRRKSECRMQNVGRTPRAFGSGPASSPRWAQPIIRRHLRPEPRLATMLVLRSSIHGLIDTSDGLSTDVGHLCEMSDVKIVLDADALPILPATQRVCSVYGLDPVKFVSGAGEDYELLFTSRHSVPPNVNGVSITRIGRVENGSGLWITLAGKTLPVTASGYDHLRAARDWKTCW